MSKKPSTSKRPASSGGNNRKVPVRSRIVENADDSSLDSSDEDYTERLTSSNRPSTSTQNRTMTQSGNNTQIGLEDLKTATNNMVKYFLSFSATKIPIKRSDINKNLNIPPKIFPEVFKDCAVLLSEVYGLEVAEVGEKSNKAYIVCTARNFGICLKQYNSQQQSEITLLFIILSYIFMKGGNIQEGMLRDESSTFFLQCFLSDHLNNFLAQLNIDINEADKFFGDVSKTVREKFVRQMYLKRMKVEIEGSNDAQVHLSFGPRAEKEIDKKQLLKAVGEIMNKSPATFINQYYEVTHGDDNTMVID